MKIIFTNIGAIRALSDSFYTMDFLTRKANDIKEFGRLREDFGYPAALSGLVDCQQIVGDVNGQATPVLLWKKVLVFVYDCGFDLSGEFGEEIFKKIEDISNSPVVAKSAEELEKALS